MVRCSNVLMFFYTSVNSSELFAVHIRMKVFMIFTDPSSGVFCSFLLMACMLHLQAQASLGSAQEIWELLLCIQ